MQSTPFLQTAVVDSPAVTVQVAPSVQLSVVPLPAVIVHFAELAQLNVVWLAAVTAQLAASLQPTVELDPTDSVHWLEFWQRAVVEFPNEPPHIVAS